MPKSRGLCSMHERGQIINIFMNMKHKSFILAALAAVAAVACGPKVSDKTAVEGSFEADAPQEINIKIKSLAIDTTVAVTDGKFAVELPADRTALANVTLGSVRAQFIPDGTPLAITVKEDGTVKIASKAPAVSVQEKYNAYTDAMAKLEKEVMAKLDSLGEEAEDSVTDAVYHDYRIAAADLKEKAFEENKGNIVGAYVLRTLQYELEPAQLDSMLNLLDPSLAETQVVSTMRKAVDAKKNTAEGKMFTDFDIKGVKLSDYVGKGKYVLVDFWASWCGPCKREIPNIKNVYTKYAGKDFDVLSVAVWDQPQASVDTAKAYGVNWNEIIDAQTIPTDLYGIQGIPHIILFGPDGTILKRDLRGEGIEEEVAKYVAAKK